MSSATILCPGPVRVAERTRAALVVCPDLGAGEPAYLDLLGRAQAALARALGAGETHDALLLAGSDASAVEAMLLAGTGTGVLIVDTGAGGERLCRVAEAYALPHRRFAPTTPGRRPDPDDLRRALRPDLDTLAVVHHETDTGLLNDLPALARFARETSRRLLVDATGSLGGEALDWAALAPEAVAAASDRCLEGLPGLGIVLARRGSRLRSRAVSLDLARVRDEGGGEAAPPAHLLAALLAAAEALAEETVAGRTRRYRAASETVRAAAEGLGLPRLLPKKLLSASLTAFLLPPGVSSARVRERLREDGFAVPGEPPGAPAPLLRVATMGQVPREALARWPDALARALR